LIDKGEKCVSEGKLNILIFNLDYIENVLFKRFSKDVEVYPVVKRFIEYYYGSFTYFIESLLLNNCIIYPIEELDSFEVYNYLIEKFPMNYTPDLIKIVSLNVYDYRFYASTKATKEPVELFTYELQNHLRKNLVKFLNEEDCYDFEVLIFNSFLNYITEITIALLEYIINFHYNVINKNNFYVSDVISFIIEASEKSIHVIFLPSVFEPDQG